ncbi:hypothetical protein Tco_0775301 [Tanacetum coccineum]
MPSFPSPEPEVSYFNDLDFFKDFENEFPAIVYNDALTSKSDVLTEPTISPRHINKFDLKDETSLSECDEKEQNVLYFNDLLPFNVIYPDDLKSDTDNDNDKSILSNIQGICINMAYPEDCSYLGLRMKYRLSLKNDMPLRDKIIIALIKKPASAAEDREFASRTSVLLREMIVAYDDKLDFIQELEAMLGVIAAVKTAEFLNETLWKDDMRLRKLQNMEMDADERAV